MALRVRPDFGILLALAAWVPWSDGRSIVFTRFAAVPQATHGPGPPTRADGLEDLRAIRASFEALQHPAIAKPSLGWILAAGHVLTACFTVNAVALVVNLLPFVSLDGARLTAAERMWRARR